MKTVKFKLLRNLESFKKGKIFDCFDGLVSGVCGIPFTNTEYFKTIYK